MATKGPRNPWERHHYYRPAYFYPFNPHDQEESTMNANKETPSEATPLDDSMEVVATTKGVWQWWCQECGSYHNGPCAPAPDGEAKQ